MKKSLLIIILALLAAVAYMQTNSRSKRLTAGAASRELLLPDLKPKAQSIKKLRLKEGDKSLTLTQKDKQWVVNERSDFPAAAEKIGTAVRELIDQKAGKPQPVGESAWGDIKLLAPGKGDAAKTGLQVEFLDEKDAVLQSVILGTNLETSKSGANSSPFGGGTAERYARLESDGRTVWTVPNQFYELKPEAADWLLKEFLNVDKIQSIEVNSPVAADSWKASRKDENATDYELEGGKDTVDSSKATITGYMASASFNDVLTKDKMTADLMKDSWNVAIKTFDGFTYGMRTVKQSGSSESDEKYLLTIGAKGEFPKERPAVKDEKPEDKKKADEEFTSKLKTLNDKLAKEKKLEGWVFEVSGYSVNTLLKKRSEVVKVASAGQENKDGTTTLPLKVDQLPAGAITPPTSVTTPPVSVPPAGQ